MGTARYRLSQRIIYNSDRANLLFRLSEDVPCMPPEIRTDISLSDLPAALRWEVGDTFQVEWDRTSGRTEYVWEKETLPKTAGTNA